MLKRQYKCPYNLQSFKNTFLVNNNINKVWEFYTDLHKFHKLDHGQKTEVADQVEFELPYGIIGKLFEGYAYNQLRKIFDHRKIATIKNLETLSV
jgi:ligand-binding SRPBCC domain-containing protein